MTSNDHHHHVHLTVSCNASPHIAGGSRGREEELASNIHKRLDTVLDTANEVIIGSDEFIAACRNVLLNVKVIIDQELQMLVRQTD